MSKKFFVSFPIADGFLPSFSTPSAPESCLTSFGSSFADRKYSRTGWLQPIKRQLLYSSSESPLHCL